MDMRVFRDLEIIKGIVNPVITIGTFDGVHLGHQKIISRLNEEAKRVGGESVLFTFYPHPRMVLYPESHGLKLIQTQAEKTDKLKRTGLQNLVVYPFTLDFSRLTATEFVRDILVNKLHVRSLVIGYDHQFGKNREGGIPFLERVKDTYGFDLIEISAAEIDEVNISSTKIRNAITEGNIELANQYLGEPYQFTGKVIEGDKIGRSLGFPTANLSIESEVKLLPKEGVYAVHLMFPNGSRGYGMMNIGYRPTVEGESKQTIEVNVFDFEQDIYDEYLTVQLLKRIRDEEKFQSLNELREQLVKDEESIRNYFLVHG